MSTSKPAQILDEDDLIPVGETARLFGVSVDTVRRWDASGIITALRTPTGQRRFRRSDVLALLSATGRSA